MVKKKYIKNYIITHFLPETPLIHLLQNDPK